MGTRFRAILDLCKRRGFLFQSAEIYGGLRGAYDYGPLGAELKRNIANAWWSTIVHQRDDIVPVDTSIITPSRVFKTSGHIDNFTDALVDCLLTKERFRPDKAPSLVVLRDSELKIPIFAPNKATADIWEKQIVELLAPGAQLSRNDTDIFLHTEEILQPVIKDGLVETEGKLILKSHTSTPIILSYNGYTEPNSNSPFLTSPRPFNLMFKTFLDSIDPIDQIINTTLTHVSSKSSIREAVDINLASSTVYLRPETAQGAFINFHHILRTMAPLHPPFGIAQQGKSFRNEIRLEHAIFRTPEFEQLELEYFVPPWESQYWFEHWKRVRINWWLEFANDRSRFRIRDHSISELAHYARGCVDIEYDFPWGWGEVEGVAHRGDFDLSRHADATEECMEYLDREPAISPQIPESDRIALDVPPSDPISYIPHVIESSAGLNRAMLAYLCDAYTEISSSKESRTILRLHPRLAPIKVAVLPLIPKPELMPFSQKVATLLRHHGIYTVIEAQKLKIGKRYYRHDEIGTPWCITIDFDSLMDGQVTLRHRDDGHQDRLRPEAAVDMIRDWLHA